VSKKQDNMVRLFMEHHRRRDRFRAMVDEYGVQEPLASALVDLWSHSESPKHNAYHNFTVISTDAVRAVLEFISQTDTPAARVLMDF